MVEKIKNKIIYLSKSIKQNLYNRIIVLKINKLLIKLLFRY